MKKRILFILLCLAFMAAIFYFSDMPATQSSQVSEPIAESTGLSQTTVRKIAHFICFFCLSGSFLGFFSTFKKLSLPAIPSFLATLCYAITDEFHQSFVPGRSCELRDVLIDSAGALSFLLIWAVAAALWRRRQNR